MGWVDGRLTFRYPDPGRHLAGVRLEQHAGLPGDRLDFDYRDQAWVLDVPAPEAWRLEYQLRLRHPDGREETVNDPANPARVPGAFGDKSVLHRRDYVDPIWLDLPAARGTWRELTVAAPALDAEVWIRTWSPPSAGNRVLVAHDGPEFDKLADLGHYAAAMVGSGALPPFHLVLLGPGDRSDWYSANNAYAATLTDPVLEKLREELGFDGKVTGMGASLGGLAMLHAQRRTPGAFAGLFLQSGSFFRPRLDPQESGFHYFQRITRFTGPVVASAFAAHPVPTLLTCGTVEENLANNREMADALARQGYPAQLVEVPDGHHFTGWRDAFDPHLTRLLARSWGETSWSLGSWGPGSWGRGSKS
jgi:enterochelin esterase-like enzyme